MNVKGGTQTWSNAPQRTEFKSEGSSNISANDSNKFFQGEAVGDTLNKVADPNFVDPSKKMRTVGNPQLGKDAFMTLLLTQMKNQDPTNPMQSHEMAAQLAQFTSLEKLSNIDSGIENLRKDNQPDHNLQSLTFIGKAITTDNSKITHLDGTEQHDVRFSLPQDAQQMTVKIKDADGNVVRTLEMKNLKAGKNDIPWNGKNDEGNPVSVGEYTAEFEALNSSGKKLFVESKIEGLITGVQFTAKGPLLMVGKQAVNMSEVKTISDPSVAAKQEEMKADGPPTSINIGGHMIPLPPELSGALPANSASAQGPKKAEVKSESKTNAKQANKMKQGSLNDLAMTQDFINTLNKQGAKAGGM
jgi:flagellar basal-body rod modification protein FlgD